MADAKRKLARWRLHLAEMTVHVVHRDGINHQAADMLYSLETTGDDQTPLEEEIPLLLLESVGKELYDIEVHHGWSDQLPENDLQETVETSSPPVAGGLPSVDELLQAHSLDAFCMRSDILVGTPGERCSTSTKTVLFYSKTISSGRRTAVAHTSSASKVSAVSQPWPSNRRKSRCALDVRYYRTT